MTVKKRWLGGAVISTLASFHFVFVGTNAAISGEAPERIASAGKIVFCTELAYPPWEMINPDTQEPEGFDIDIAKAVTDSLGVESEHKDIAFDGLIPALQAGQCDAIISGLADKPERREVVDFVNYAVAGNSLITKADSSATFENLTDLSGLKVSVAVGSALEQELTAANDELKSEGKDEMRIVSLQGGTDAFQQLTAGLADVYLGSTDQAAYYNKQSPGLVRLASPQMLTLTTGIATLHKDRDLHEAINEAFDEIRANGTYDKILEDWGFQTMSVE